MSNNQVFAEWLLDEIEENPTSKDAYEKQLESMIYPNLYTFFTMGLYDREPQDTSMLKTFAAHKKFAQRCAEEAIVLLKNEDAILPITPGKKIVLVGEPELFTGNGSGYVAGYDHVSYETGLKNLFGDDFTAVDINDKEAIEQADIVLFNFNKASGEGHDIPFEEPTKTMADLGTIVKLNKHVIVLLNAANTMPTPWLKDVKAVLWCSFLGQERGTALARILSGQVSPSGKLPFTFKKDFQDSPDPEFNYIGNKPYWHGKNQYRSYWLGLEEEYDTAFSNHVAPHQLVDIPYKEGVFMGYRWFESKDIPVVFPFGHGLSYTQFDYNSMQVENRWNTSKTIRVRIQIKNSGQMDAKEAIQLYVSDQASTVQRPEKELKAFKKINTKAGETTTVEFELDSQAFAYWDTEHQDWRVTPGAFEILVGTSSQDIRLQEKIRLDK